MATGAGGDGLFWGVYEGCLSAGDMDIQRRPYHKNCGCMLHKSRLHCTHSSRCNSLSYPLRRSWSESSLELVRPTASPGSMSPTVAKAAGEMRRTQSRLAFCEEDDQGVEYSSSTGVSNNTV
ncbi:hypothetical protein F511_02529 [Dorcoceras hygrometricum]|nr:hypothetical protein F511_02529 [Dorcoceras hygrometricum]